MSVEIRRISRLIFSVLIFIRLSQITKSEMGLLRFLFYVAMNEFPCWISFHNFLWNNISGGSAPKHGGIILKFKQNYFDTNFWFLFLKAGVLYQFKFCVNIFFPHSRKFWLIMILYLDLPACVFVRSIIRWQEDQSKNVGS